jgi:sulfoxide reductase heme-binding subunit YedZ
MMVPLKKVFSLKVLWRTLLHLIMILPALWLFNEIYAWLRGMPHELSANPVQYVTHFTGNWAVRLLILGLFISPMREIFKWMRLLKYRRMIGLYGFFYALLHLLSFIGLDHFFNWQMITGEIFKRLPILIGMLAFTLLLPLAFTSTKKAVRRLKKRWNKLHRLVYLIAVLAVLHHYMMVKADVLTAQIEMAILSVLLGYRIFQYFKKSIKIKKKEKRVNSSPDNI